MTRPAPTPAKLLEADVTRQCLDFLEAHGWRPVRMGRGVATFGNRGTVTFGEPGVTDWEMIKYIPTSERGLCRLVWCEFKQPGSKKKCICLTKKPRQRCTYHDQIAWQARERARGALVVKVDSLEQLQGMGWYR